MTGLTFITDETRKKRFVQIDLDAVRKNKNRIEDIMDILIAEARKDEEKIPLKKVKEQLKKAGKL